MVLNGDVADGEDSCLDKLFYLLSDTMLCRSTTNVLEENLENFGAEPWDSAQIAADSEQMPYSWLAMCCWSPSALEAEAPGSERTLVMSTRMQVR